MIKKILLVVSIILLVLFQIGFLKEFSNLTRYFNLILIIAIFLTFISEFKTPIIFVFVSGFILDIYSLHIFGVYTFSLLLTILCIKYLSSKYINQKTYYSLVIIALVGTIIYNLILISIINIFYIINISEFAYNINLSLLKDIVFQLIIHSFLLGLLLYIKRFVVSKLKSKVYLKFSNE